MKKALGILFSYLFVSTFVYFFIPKVVYAETCDPLKYDQGAEHAVLGSCPAGECTNSSILGFSWCWPSSPTGTSFEPTCPPGFTVPGQTNSVGGKKDFICDGKSICCEAETIGQGVCKLKPNNFPVFILSCENVKDKALSLSEKNWCPDLTTKYDPSRKRCVKFVENTWRLTYSCGDKDNNGQYTGIATAIGCVPTGKPEKFVEFLYKWAFGAAAGIITIMVILTGYKVLTSGGNPEQLQSAKENIVSIFSGLILIAFSLVLLQAVGANILQLPTF